MKVAAIPAWRLTAEQVRAWADFQGADPALESPYFRPEFTQAVAAVRPGVWVGVIEDAGEPVGFFPFERRRWGFARPVGAPMCDYHGVVARQGVTWNVNTLLDGCGLLAWDFDHLPAAQSPFHPYHSVAVESPYVDLAGGFDAYLEARKRAGSASVTETLRKLRKAHREVGPVRLEAHVDEGRAAQVFETLRKWKSAQYRQSGITDLFALAWPVRLLERILAEKSEGFAGMLSALYYGDRLAAVHLGIRSGGVLHCWFPAYDSDLGAKYSPGMALMVELARNSAALGIRRIDLGKGKEEWKARLASGAVPLAEGCASANGMVRLARCGLRRAKAWALTSRFGAPVRAAARCLRRMKVEG